VTGVCEHGYLDGDGCDDCGDPRGGAPAFVMIVLLGIVAAVVVAFLLGRWVGDHAAPRPSMPPAAAGTWCGQTDEVIALNLTQGVGGRLSGELSFGGRPFMTVVGRVEEGGIVMLQTVYSTTRFELSGALVAGRLRLNVIDDAGDVGRVELRHC
jgi:hypothetical protein